MSNVRWKSWWICGWLLIAGLLVSGASARASRLGVNQEGTRDLGLQKGQSKAFDSEYLSAPIVVDPGVFRPDEAEQLFLPLMQENPELFDGKSVLEIGTGSGIISLYAAELGAARVVATDISLAAVACARANVLRLRHEATVEVRQVPKKAPTAYSVIRQGETFDLIISNPPYSLDLAPIESRALEDSGDLGFSIIRGLAAHLAPAGACVLLYDSHFYHNVIVKLAQHLGYKVAHQEPTILSPLETEALYNSYLSRLLAREHLSPDSFEFDWTKDKLVLFVETKPQSLFGEAKPRKHPGIIVITRNVSEGEN